MPNFSFSTASNFLRFTPETLDDIRKGIAEKQEKARRGEPIEEEIIQPQLDLKVCKKLPALYGKPPPWLIGEPLEDLDPYYKTHETFMVLTSRRRIFRFTATKALFLFSPFNPLRRLAIKILTHTWFIAFITCVVLVNSALMTVPAFMSNCNGYELFFAVTYAIEFAIKIVARGFVWNEFTYLRDPWNCLDFFVLIMTYVALCNSAIGNISALRIFKVLRTFKAVSVLPGLKVIVGSLFHSIKKLANVMLLTVFCLSVFGLVGLQLFMGNLKNKCVPNTTTKEDIRKNNNSWDDLYLSTISCYLMNYTCDPLLCYNLSDSGTCPDFYICENFGANPDYGYTSFDHFGWAFLSLFRLMTQDSWEQLYRQVIRSSGKSFSLFFVVVIFMCSFYLFNLILAVVIMAYEEQNKATLAHTKARELLLQEAKEILRKEQESAARKYEVSSDENMQMPEIESNKKEQKSKKKKKFKKKKPKTYGEDETMFYSTPDKTQKELKEILMSYNLPADIANNPFQRQKLTSAANILSKSMEWEESKLEFPPGLKRAAQKYLIWKCCPLWLQVKEMVKKIIMNPFAEIFITLCIIVNTLIMALEHTLFCPDQIKLGNLIFTGIFTIEMILKIIALDPYYYFQNPWNVFDFLTAIIGIISVTTKKRLAFFRLLRIFKLSKFWPALNKLMKIMLKSVGPLGNLTLVLIFTVFIFALVGNQGFGNFYNKTGCKDCEAIPLPNSNCSIERGICTLRWHMYDFLHSFLIIFRILCGEWIETMWDCMRITKKEGWCIVLFMTVLVVGNLVVLNLFIALLLSSFSSSAPAIEEEKDPNLQSAFAHIHSRLQFVKHWLWDLCCNGLMQKLKASGTQNKKVTVAIPNANQKEYTTEMKEFQENYVSNEIFKYWDKTTIDGNMEDFMSSSNKCVCVPLAEDEVFSDEEECTVTKMDYSNQRSDLDTSGSEISTVDQIIVCSLLPEKRREPEDCFPKGCAKIFSCCVVNSDTFPGGTWWRFRKTCFKIIKHSWFEYFIIFMILLSSFTLTFEDIDLKNLKNVKTVLDYADKVFFYIFFLEMLLKWVAYGFKKYFTNAWCWLDFFIVCISLASLAAEARSKEKNLSLCDNRSSIKSLRTLRALRPLRALSRFKGIKVVVNALVGAIPSIGNVLLVCIVLWLPFNILGVNLFGDKSESDRAGLVCNNTSSTRVNNSVNFNNVGNGYLALLQVATFKGWTDIMDAAVDGSGDCFESNKYAYFYFVAFIIFGSFFMLNLFIGVVIDNFNQQRKKISGELIFLSEDQKKYYNALKKLGNKKLQKPVPRPLNKYQGFCFDIINKKAFDIFILSLIFLNVVVMAVEHEDQGKEAENLLGNINVVFVSIFTGECIMKIFALRHYYFRDSWNIFDFVVMILSIATTSLKDLFPPTLLRVIRVARISRLLRLVRGARGLRTLLFALLMSLPALANIGLLLFLVMFIYAIFGMTNFACSDWKYGIDNTFNFQTFGSSMLCLFQITTSAGWHSLLRPMLESNDQSNCAPNLHINRSLFNGSCVNSTMAITYFISYIIISFLIVVNMYVAVIIENFNVATEESTEPLSDYDFEIFYEIWAKFDPYTTQFIAYSELSDFADSLEEPLRIPKPNNQQLLRMDLPMVNGNKIHCLDVLFAFTKRVLGESGEMDSLEAQIEAKYVKANPRKLSYEPIVTTPKRKEHECAIIIQRAFRVYRLQCAMQKANDESCVSIPLEDIIEEEGSCEFRPNESEDSLLDKSQSPSSISIPPSYSNVIGTTDGIPQVKVTDSSDDDK
ncbi:sodium channel protein type 5 subunit alpha-like [Eublepharis macularius]|uniref:Sodium channel protein n=1 Tax=Eublepharis macularius TaxID=481883 RepID=A0AA97JWR6_EUBMA|nr:sodium channel protein type 5 subunit alpha-like [Eublepharis macularius]